MSELASAFRAECSVEPWTSMDLPTWLGERLPESLAQELGCGREELAALLGVAAAAGELDPEVSPDGAAEHCLAIACQRGVTGAVARFRSHYLDGLRPVLASYGLDDGGIDDVLQRTTDKLLVSSDGPCKLRGYAGRGRLRGLVKVAATRLAVDEARRRKRHRVADDGDLAALPDPEHDPELAYLKRTYRAHFREAFAVATEGLDSRARNLLRMHLLHGITLAQLATSYSVHRATIVRWLTRAREQLLEGTEAEMRRRLRVSDSELESVMGLIGSRLDASVARLLATTRE